MSLRLSSPAQAGDPVLTAMQGLLDCPLVRAMTAEYGERVEEKLVRCGAAIERISD